MLISDPLPALLAILPLITASDVPPLPPQVLSASARVRHEFLDLQPHDDQYLQSNPIPAVTQALQAMRDTSAQAWVPGRPSYQVVPNEQGKGKDVFAKVSLSLQGSPHRISFIMVLENVEEQAADEDPVWTFSDLVQAEEGGTWCSTLDEAWTSCMTDDADVMPSAADYWGSSSSEDGGDLSGAAVNHQNSFLDLHSTSPLTDSFKSQSGRAAEQNSSWSPNSRSTLNGIQEDEEDLRHALRGVFRLFVRSSSREQKAQKTVFLRIAHDVAQESSDVPAL